MKYRDLEFFSVKWRAAYLAIAMVIFLLSYYVGASIHLSVEQANNVRLELQKRNKNLDAFGIFANNVIPSLEMFIPAGGVGIGVYSALSTGQAFSAFATLIPALKNVSAMSAFVSPFAIMELFAYGIAISRSGILAYQMVTHRKDLKHNWKRFFVPTVIEIGIVVIILALGSLVEWEILLARQHHS